MCSASLRHRAHGVWSGLYGGIVAAVAFTLVAGQSAAREPGIAPVTPPGLTLGIPIAGSLPAGVYWTQRTSYYDAELTDASGHSAGAVADIVALSSQVTYVPGFKLLGATYKAFVIVPLVDQWLNRTTRATGAIGQFNRVAFANPKIEPLNLTWDLGEGFNVGAGFGVYVPAGQYHVNNPINLGTSFYTVESSAGFTYLKDGWNVSLQAVYDTNTSNEKLHYHSGDQLILNATVTKNIGGFNVGPVGYFQRQITADSNSGGRTTFGGRTFSSPENIAVGGFISHAIGASTLSGYVTRDVTWSNTFGGTKFWLSLSFKFI